MFRNSVAASVSDRDILDYVHEARRVQMHWLLGCASADELSELKGRYVGFKSGSGLTARAAAAGPAGLRVIAETDLQFELAAERFQHKVDGALEAPALVSGQKLRYHDLVAAARVESDRHRRVELWAAAERLLCAAAPARLQVWQMSVTQAQACGFSSYAELFLSLKGYSATSMRLLARQVLDLTQRCYDRLLADYRQRARVPDSDVLELHDIAWLMRVIGSDVLGQCATAQILSKVLCGLARDRASCIQVDLAEREGKSSRPFAVALDPPRSVYLAVRQSGTPRDLVEGLHEGGHAASFACVDPDISREARMLAWDSVQECYAFLCAGMAQNPVFWSDFAGQQARSSEAMSRSTAFCELYLIRRYAAKVLFELSAFDAHALDDLDDSYDQLVRAATGVRQSSGRWMFDTDSSLYSLDYLAAWLLEAAVRKRLSALASRVWWTDPDAGEILHRLWRRGGEVTMADLLEVSSLDGLTAAPLGAQFACWA